MPPSARNRTSGPKASSSRRVPPSASGVTAAVIAPRHRPLGFELALVVVVSIAVLVPGIWRYSLVDPWETHYGEVARMMLQNNDWVHTEWPQDGEGFRSKPVLQFWMMAAGMRAVGIAENGGLTAPGADVEDEPPRGGAGIAGAHGDADARGGHGPEGEHLGGGGGVDAPDAEWERVWNVNVMAHVYAARAVLPSMVERGSGYVASTASAAGLLTNIGNAPYSVTKHAAVALAEWIAVTYGDAGIKVSCLCPQGVRTPMLELAMDDAAGAAALNAGGLIEPEDVAASVVEGIADERLLILPHAEVAQFMALRGSNHERWIGGMRKLVRNARAAARQ